MDLATGREIRRPQVKECVMTTLVIKRVEQLAAIQGIKTLRFLDRKKKEIIFDDSDLAGVNDFRLDGIIDPNFLPDEKEEDEEFTHEEKITENELEELLAEEIDEENKREQDSESTDDNENEIEDNNVVNLNDEEINADSDKGEIVLENDDDSDGDYDDDDDEITGVTYGGRPTRVRIVPDRLDPNPSSKSYFQAPPLKERVVRFMDLELA